jgi:hypothetical protein
MRRVPLKVVEFHGPHGEPLPPLHYSEALVLLARTPQGQGGVAAEEMTSPLAVIEAISVACERPIGDGEERCVFLEEVDWAWLVERLKANRFPFVSHVFKDMVEAVIAAPKLDPHQLNGGPVDKPGGGVVPGPVEFAARDL